ncbi:hypothetical protein [Sorangium sp. So ce1335]|uniref:hypothetical protein n=1 Tax=Sorangium sp. So ce1335 TaxID=3133335 RepID=UPI003F629F5B
MKLESSDGSRRSFAIRKKRRNVSCTWSSTSSPGPRVRFRMRRTSGANRCQTTGAAPGYPCAAARASVSSSVADSGSALHARPLRGGREPWQARDRRPARSEHARQYAIRRTGEAPRLTSVASRDKPR